jgi:hypothetical protein
MRQNKKSNNMKNIRARQIGIRECIHSAECDNIPKSKYCIPKTIYIDKLLVLLDHNFILVDKQQMKPVTTNWKYCAEVLFRRTDDIYHRWRFVGWELQNNQTKTGKAYIALESDDTVIELIEPKEIEDYILQYSPVIEQPWFDDNIIVYQHLEISRVFDKILAKQVVGLPNGVTFIHVVMFLLSESIPVFIVGGAVRDIIHHICVEKKNNNVDQLIKDIDIAFGCSSTELIDLLKLKRPTWNNLVHYASGLVQLGDNRTDLYLEGKSIAGPNNA